MPARARVGPRGEHPPWLQVCAGHPEPPDSPPGWHAQVRPEAIIPLVERFDRRRWDKFNSEKVCHISYARIQGRSALVSHFQNSSLMHEDKRCRPVLLVTDGPDAGEQEPFPVGPNVRPRSLPAGAGAGAGAAGAGAGAGAAPFGAAPPGGGSSGASQPAGSGGAAQGGAGASGSGRAQFRERS